MGDEIIFQPYISSDVVEMVPWEKGMNIDELSILQEDLEALSPKKGDMIARDPNNPDDMWLVPKYYFEANFALPSEGVESQPRTKTFKNTDADGASKNVEDIVFWGDGDTFKLISKASSQYEGWMKSTKAMQVPGGCIVQVTTQQGNNIAEALTFAPGVRIREEKDSKGKVISRTLK